MKRSILCCALLASVTAQADSIGPLWPQQTGDMPAQQALAPKRERALPAPAATVIDLGPFEGLKAELAEPSKAGMPERIGLRRDIEQLKSEAQTDSALHWSATPMGGHVAAISLISADAVSLRAALHVRRLPSSAVVRFYTQQDATPIEVHASTILQAIERNIASGDQSEKARTYWSPPLQGDEITLEIELPKGISTDALEISVPMLSHLFRSPTDPAATTEEVKFGNSASCEVDYACEANRDASLDVKSRSTAKMTFVDDGLSYLCSGTLLNNTNQDRTPYFLTANHCISSQTSASTLTTYWFYRAASCYGLSVDPATTTLHGGAQLLYNSAQTDTAFLKLNEPAPAAATFAGWSAEPVFYNNGLDVLGVHYPKGDVQKVSRGRVSGYATCTSSGGQRFTCRVSDQSRATFVSVTWRSGVTEGGSSGSSLFSNGYVIGQLYGGGSSCSLMSNPDKYGLLSVAYNAKLKQWLKPGSATPTKDTVVEYYNPDLDHYFMTADSAEQVSVDAGAAGRWIRTGQTFKAGGKKAVCRFYGNALPNPATGAAFGPNSHFYTVDTQECEFLVGFYNPAEPSWKFESYDFSTSEPVAGACAPGTVPVYRVYNNGYAKGVESNHRFVRDINLANQMGQEGWSVEGVKMCAPQ